MTNKNQTAVDFLIDEIRNQIKIHGKLSAISLSKLKMQAKEIEKQNIIKFANDFLFHDNTDLTAEQYYNETYEQ